jgi:hypothetical protein
MCMLHFKALAQAIILLRIYQVSVSSSVMTFHAFIFGTEVRQSERMLTVMSPSLLTAATF